MTIYSFQRCFIVSVSILTAFIFGSAGTAFANPEDHITRTESGFYYTVQKGDTLWDLSQHFADSPWEWPELWHYNPQIPNPHLIYPGQKIVIFKKEWEGREKPGQVLSAFDEPEIKEVTPAPPPVKKPAPSYEVPEIDGIGFIRKTAVPGLGAIIKAQDDMNLITTNNIIYISPGPEGQVLAVGDRLFSFHTIDPVSDPDTREVIGVQHVLTGIIDIIRIEENIALGSVFKAFREISLQDRVMPYWQRSPEIFFRESPPSLSGKVLKATDDWGIIAQNTLIFIDKGADHGVATGDLFDIFHLDAVKPDPAEFNTIDLPPEYVGQLLVLHTENETATAIILDSKKPIIPGDRIGEFQK
jgi:LysM repeat protein